MEREGFFKKLNDVWKEGENGDVNNVVFSSLLPPARFGKRTMGNLVIFSNDVNVLCPRGITQSPLRAAPFPFLLHSEIFISCLFYHGCQTRATDLKRPLIIALSINLN